MKKWVLPTVVALITSGGFSYGFFPPQEQPPQVEAEVKEETISPLTESPFNARKVLASSTESTLKQFPTFSLKGDVSGPSHSWTYKEGDAVFEIQTKKGSTPPKTLSIYGFQNTHKETELLLESLGFSGVFQETETKEGTKRIYDASSYPIEVSINKNRIVIGYTQEL